VVCFTPDHDASFAALSPRRVRTVLEAWIDRTLALGALPETRQVYCFENRGEEIGVTLHHPHGQIYAFPFVAPRLAQMVTQAREYAAGHDGANLFDDLVAAEVAARTSTGWHSCPRRPAGRTRCGYSRSFGCLIFLPSMTRPGTRSGPSTWTC
jgi:galactose-1-phosphate uridylyltransferase